MFAHQKRPGQIDIHSTLPLFKAQLFYRAGMRVRNASVVNNGIQATTPVHCLGNDILNIRFAGNVACQKHDFTLCVGNQLFTYGLVSIAECHFPARRRQVQHYASANSLRASCHQDYLLHSFQVCLQRFRFRQHYSTGFAPDGMIAAV